MKGFNIQAKRIQVTLLPNRTSSDNPWKSKKSKALNRIFCWSFDNIDIEEKNVVKID